MKYSVAMALALFFTVGLMSEAKAQNLSVGDATIGISGVNVSRKGSVSGTVFVNVKQDPDKENPVKKCIVALTDKDDEAIIMVLNDSTNDLTTKVLSSGVLKTFKIDVPGLAEGHDFTITIRIIKGSLKCPSDGESTPIVDEKFSTE